MDAQQQYALQMQARYYKFLERENEREQQQQQPQNVVKKKKSKSDFTIVNVIIDSDCRDTTLYPDANDFVVKLQDAVKMVAALRILKTEFYQPSNSFGYFVLNEAKIPLQLYNISHAYLYLNGYKNTMIANDGNSALVGRIGPGLEMYPAVTGDPLKDPFICMFRPIEGKVRRFHVKLLNADGSSYPVTNARVVLTVALYCVT